MLYFNIVLGELAVPTAARHNRSRSDIIGSFAQKFMNENAGMMFIIN